MLCQRVLQILVRIPTVALQAVMQLLADLAQMQCKRMLVSLRFVELLERIVDAIRAVAEAVPDAVVGAYRALVENHLDGVLVSCSGQLNRNYVPFEELVDPETLVTVVRLTQSGSDFQRLARFLENFPHD